MIKLQRAWTHRKYKREITQFSSKLQHAVKLNRKNGIAD